MSKLVTIGTPFYRRLTYLSHVLKVVEAQDYPSIELIVSDNGQNGRKIRETVEAYYSRPYKLRQNPSTVSIATHYNQIVRETSGEYFVLLSDDDEISPNFVSELVKQLERHPEACIAFGGQEIFSDEAGVMARSREVLPDIISGGEFILATWKKYEYGFQSVTTFLAKTERIRALGGFPDFCKGTHMDDALVIKLCLNSQVVFSDRCTFRNRVQESSLGWSMSAQELAAACKQFMRFLDDDLTINEFARKHPSEWLTLKRVLVEMSWGMYFERWRTIYKKRLPFFQWMRMAFGMPFIPKYYRKLGSVFRAMAKGRLKRLTYGVDTKGERNGSSQGCH